MKLALLFALLVLLCVSVAGQLHTAAAVEEAPLPFEAEPQPLQPIIAEGQSMCSQPAAPRHLGCGLNSSLRPRAHRC
jgi:hypothetical protein